MALPTPFAGLVISYAYLWKDEARQGWKEGRKDRPSVIVLSVRTVAGHDIVTVAPITHRRPETEATIELPRSVGALPRSLYRALRDRVVASAEAGQLKITLRDE